MKQLLCVSFVLLTISGFTQKTDPVAPTLPRNPENDQVYYMEVVTAEGVNKDELMKRARIWMKQYFKNPTGIVDEIDTINGKMVLKPQFATYRTLKDGGKAQSAIVKYTLILSFKDGKYRYEMKDLNLQQASYYPIERLFNDKDPNAADNFNTLNETDKYMLQLIDNLDEEMEKPSNQVKKDEW